MKLLIVEDEAKIADYLRKGLAEEGYVIDVAANGIDGLHMASHGNYDLIVLDTMLPRINRRWCELSGCTEAEQANTSDHVDSPPSDRRSGTRTKNWSRRLPCQAFCLFRAGGSH